MSLRSSTDAMQSRFRKWLANKLAALARRIYPQSEEVMSFWVDRMTELVITGQSTIKVSAVNPEDMYLDTVTQLYRK